MLYDRLSRRHFLQGLGASLTLPLLPSLMGRAEAQTMTLPRFFVTTWVGHGGISTENAYPLDATSTLTDTTIYPASGSNPAHVARSARLVDLKRTHAQTLSARTQSVMDADNGAGMAISFGRVERCPTMGLKLFALAHNTLRGAAGAAVLNAELLVHTGRVTA
jgi:hypothetical protein